MAIKSAILFAGGVYDVPIARRHMEAIAYTHAHDHMDIKPEFYPLWLESMLRTIKAHDPNFSEVLEEAWREVLTFTINFMIFKI